MWKPNIFCAGPSGAKLFLICGATKRLFEEPDFLSNVNHFTGVSAGAAMTLLLVIGYKIDEIIEICMDLTILDDLASISLDQAKEKLGLIPNKTIEKTLSDAIIRKFGFIPTLKQLFCLTGVTWTAVTFNVDKMKSEFLDKDSEPDLSVLEAAMMSMAIPFLIQPRKYKGCTFVDGGVVSPLPVLHFDHSGNKILAVYISSDEDLSYSDKHPTLFLYRLIHSGMKALREFNIDYSSENVKFIPLKTAIKDTTGISLDRETREKMVDYGYLCAETFLKINSNPDKYEIKLGENEEIPF